MAMVVTMVVVMVFLMIILIVVYANRYKKASPSQAVVVWGKQPKGVGKYQIVTNGGIFVVPFVQQSAFLPLDAKTQEFRLRNVPCKKKKRIDLELTVTYKISNKEKKLQKAAESLLHKSQDNIEDMAKKIIDAEVRNLCWKMDSKKISDDPGKAGKKFKKNANKELGAVGIEITTFSIKDVLE